MASDRWEYDQGVRRYRDTDSGRFLSKSTVITLRDDAIASQRGRARDLADQLGNRDISLRKWEREMRTVVKEAHGIQYVFGRGGRNAMTPADWGSLGAEVKAQYGHLRSFSEDIAAGKLSPAQVGARGEMYVESGVHAYERGHTAAWGMPRLSRYPGDGQSECKGRCKCRLDITVTDTGWDVYWRLGAADHCDGCVSQASAWAPLAVAREAAEVKA